MWSGHLVNVETMQWLVDLYASAFSSAAVAVSVLLTILFLLYETRRWLTR